MIGAAAAAAYGDLGCDGEVGHSDTEIVAEEVFGATQGAGTCAAADVNADGRVSAADFPALVAGIVVVPTPSSTATAAPTATPGLGPRVTFLGLAAADGTAIGRAQIAPDGTAIFQRSGGAGFYLVVEADRGASGLPVGLTVFHSKPGDPRVRPDLQVEVSRPLGQGDLGVCVGGGVPGFDPEDFSERKEVADALNDLGCGFSVNTSSVRTCTLDGFGSPTFMSDPRPEVQYCLLVDSENSFPPGDTRVVVQVRDVGGDVGPRVSLVVRVGNQTGPTSTIPPSVTRTPTTTRTATAVPARSPTTTPQPGRSPTSTATVVAAATASASPSASAPVATRTPTASASAVATASPTGPPATASPTASAVVSAVATRTATARATTTRSPAPTASMTATKTSTAVSGPTNTPTSTNSPARTNTATPSWLPSVPTPTWSPPATASRSASPSRTPTPTPTGTHTRTATWTPRVPPTASASPSRTPTRTRVPTRTATESPTVTTTPTPSVTRTATPTSSPTGTRTSTRTFTETPTLTPSRTPSLTRTPSTTPTPTWTATPTLTRTVTATPTVTGTPTPTVPPEPFITFFGVARADGTVVETPTAMLSPDVPIYERPSFGFFLVVEGRPGATGARMGTSAYAWDAGNPTLLPDLQVIVSRPLGNGSMTVCDESSGNRGGVPATEDFTSGQSMADAVNDLGCRFKDAGGEPGGRGASDACTRLRDGTDAFWGDGTTVQFCGLIDRPFEFPRGDTLVRVRLRDEAGHLSEPSGLVVRVP